MSHTAVRRLGALAATGALGVAALVGLATPAQAATAAATYTCTFPSLGAKDIPVNITATLPPTAAAGLDAPAIPVLLSVTLPGDVVDAAKGLFGATTIGGFSNDMVASLNDTASTDASDLALQNAKFPQTAVPATPSTALTLNTPNPLADPAAVPASTVPVSLPGAGTYDIAVPSAFTFTATKQGEAVMLADVPCALKAGSPSSLGQVTLTTNTSKTTAKAAKKVTKLGKKTVLKVVVAADNEVPSGKVTVMKGKKVLGKGTLNSKGKAKITLKKALPAGKTAVKISYAGDDFTKASKSKKVVIRVR
ncbi:DUF6801 domain-containing protein [Nocardioides hwasunensis]|uniref:Ig-like domain repeat protein n=1 Tax=Nocardioides hwasunensis TaxID=397258 RepID=A0ABR8MDR4_9ACTN|nr:DUF6801 domain-containing protein [Nocardioides hwasunensis]MBD3914262.1 Ig-like domain repeat protein [Nocardioides hwasunensis]